MRLDNQLTLSDGNQLGYARYGRDDGIPAFYFHGLPGSRREGEIFHRACLDAGVQLIAPDRPGYGLSDPVSGARFTRWPRLVARLADHLGFERFHLLAISGGAPYALACASLLPERMRGTAICCGLGEVSHVELRARMPPQARLGFWLAGRGAAWLKYSYGPVTVIAARHLPELAIEIMARLNGGADRSVLREPAIKSLFAANLREAFRQGSVGGVADMCAAVAPWPFDPSGIQALQLWHGRRDGVVPWHHTERLARRVPAARVKYLPGEGHFSLPVRFGGAIVDALISG
jgi:pimeloyl-ACP methyl ester carboxylesterase